MFDIALVCTLIVGAFVLFASEKVGIPLNLLFWVIASILIPIFWPLQ